MVPGILEIKLATTLMAGWMAAASPVPVPAGAIALMLESRVATPVEVKLYDENLRVNATVILNRDGTADDATKKQVRHLFRCRVTNWSQPIARRTLALLADVADRHEGETIEFVSAYRAQKGESRTSPHRDARAIDFRIRGRQLRDIRDYLWRNHSEVGIGWYPSEQFIHMDSRPTMHDTAWTFLNGKNRYKPYWAALARRPRSRAAQARHVISRFAPSTTGEAHPGTLLSALLVWLDARSRGGRVLLRLEDLDTTRVKDDFARMLQEACAWIGLDWDEVIVQSDRRAAHEAALDALDAQGRLYACACSRAQRAGGRRAPDGGWAYPNTCRGRRLAHGWRSRAKEESIRVRLPDDAITLVDEGGLDLSQTPALDMGDPVVVRKDAVIAYQLAVVVDDQAAQITDVVRGRDIAPSTATQIMLQRLLGYQTPRYRHHFLLLEGNGDKLAKLHGSLPFSELRDRHTPRSLCSALGRAANLGEGTPQELLQAFDWTRVPREDRLASDYFG